MHNECKYTACGNECVGNGFKHRVTRSLIILLSTSFRAVVVQFSFRRGLCWALISPALVYKHPSDRLCLRSIELLSVRVDKFPKI